MGACMKPPHLAIVTSLCKVITDSFFKSMLIIIMTSNLSDQNLIPNGLPQKPLCPGQHSLHSLALAERQILHEQGDAMIN